MTRFGQGHTSQERSSPRYFDHLEGGRLNNTSHHSFRTLPPPVHTNNHRSRFENSGSYASIARTALRARANNERNRYFPRQIGHRQFPREFQRTANQLDAANSNLRALLEDPIPTMSPSSLMSATNESTSEAEGSRHSKRRKLDTDKQPTNYKGFSYGYYGQVVPGQLKMEIVSCDGGSFESDSNKHAAENVLRDDHSVYCTKANRCNLILRHQGATPFCLDELIIKAPPRGYTAP